MPLSAPALRSFVASALAIGVLAFAVVVAPAARAAQPPPTCGDSPLELKGTATPDKVETYELHPFVVPAGTAHIEVGYEWTPVDSGVIDLGLWDPSGTSGPDAFRFWSGSRQGRLDKGMDPVIVAPDRNERTVVPGAIDAGTWNVELGLAALDEPLDWRVVLRCPQGPAAPVLAPDPVDPTHVANPAAGWYAGDFHLHSYHSSPNGLSEDETIKAAIKNGLQIVPVTDYVTTAQWSRLGAAQRAHPDVLVWPGREVITYDGHMIVLGETPHSVEYRLGHDGTTIGDIQRASVKDGGLVSLAHPTIFPPETFGALCRGCFLQAIGDVDWSSVQMIEVVTESSLAELNGTLVPNPFVATAVELWESELRAGHRLTAVSGSDDKEGDRYGATSTMVYAQQLSRPMVDRALRDGHAYVRSLGQESPTIEVEAVGADGTKGILGDTLVAASAELKVTVKGGNGQALALRRDGVETQRVPITSDSFTQSFPITRGDDRGPLGTFWGVEVHDTTKYPGADLRTVIANPVFLDDAPATPLPAPTFTAPPAAKTSGSVPPEVAAPPAAASSTTSSSASAPLVALFGVVVVVAIIAVVVLVAARRRGESGQEV